MVNEMQELLTPQEAADFLRIKIRTIYDYTSRKKIPFYKVGHKVVFDKADLIKWVRESRKDPINV